MTTVQVTAKLVRIGQTLMVHISTPTGLFKTLPPEPWLIEFFGLTQEWNLATRLELNDNWIPSMGFSKTDEKNITRKSISPR